MLKAITARTETVLERLQANRARHQVVVAEARAGYLEAAIRALKARLKRLDKGEQVALVFDLRVPIDRTPKYDTAIAMLSLHRAAGGETIELTASDVQCYIEDQWDWSPEWRAVNSTYSASLAHAVEE